MAKWNEKELGHLRQLLRTNQSGSINSIAREAHQTIKRRSVQAISHKLRELQEENSVVGDTVELAGASFPASVVSGYVIITLPNGKSVPAHIWLWEQHYGAVPTGYHVHHCNFERTDNRIENLQLMTAEDHQRLHHSGKPPETAMLFWFLQEHQLWDEYLTRRDEYIDKVCAQKNPFMEGQ